VITFTGEALDGNSDLYRVNTDGTGIETLIATPSFEDAGVLSPDGTTLAYVSTKGNYTANIWVMDIESGVSSNLTDTALTKGVNTAPQGPPFFFALSYTRILTNYRTFPSRLEPRWRM
jgi:sugar lactone lactonase YvrE